MKKIILITIFSINSLLLGTEKTPLLDCVVEQIVPAHANFFSFGSPPRIGDETSFDLNVSEIDDIRFKSGTELPLKRYGAKIIKEEENPTIGLSDEFIRFSGSHTGTQGVYRGLLIANLYGENPRITFQILKESGWQGFSVHSLYLACTKVE